MRTRLPPPPPTHRVQALARSLSWLVLSLLALPLAAQPLEVAVRMQGDRIVVDVNANVPARRGVVWAVLTDYDHMAGYVSNLTSSVVLSRAGNVLEVEQRGRAAIGPMSFSFWTVRAVEFIEEREVRSQLLRGDFKTYDFTTRIGTAGGGGTTLTHHGEYVPKAWIPPLIGTAMIESGIRKQYEQLMAEMLRREAREAAPAR